MIMKKSTAGPPPQPFYFQFFFMVEGKPYAFEDFKEFHDQDQPTSSGFFKKSNFAHQILCASSLVMAPH